MKAKQIKRHIISLSTFGAAGLACCALFYALITPPSLNINERKERMYNLAPVTDLGPCIMNKIAVGGAGDIILWNDPTDDPLADYEKGGLSNLMILRAGEDGYEPLGIAGPNSLRPISFARNGDILLRDGFGISLFRYLDDKKKIVSAGKLPATLMGIEFLHDGKTSLDQLASPDSAETIAARLNSGDYVRNMFGLYAGNLAHIGIAKNYEIHLNGKPSGLSALNARRVAAVLDGAGQIRLISDGLDPDPESNQRISHVIDRSSNNAIGRYSEGRIYAPPLLRNASALPERHAYIRDVGSFGTNYAYFSYDASGFGVVSFFQNGKKMASLVRVCRSDMAGKSEIEFDKIDLIDGQFSYIYKYSSNTKATTDTAIIFFHGGPASTIRDNPYPDVVRKLLTPHTDIFAIDYLGSALTGKEFGLAGVDPVASIEQAQRVLASELRDKLAGYRRIVVISESFGAVPANIIRKQGILRVDGYIYIAPLLKLRSPKDWLASAKGVQFQMLFEAAAFGGSIVTRQETANYINTLSNRERINVPSMYIFGENDKISKPNDLASVGAMSSAEIESVDGANHETVAGFEEVWLLSRDFINRI